MRKLKCGLALLLLLAMSFYLISCSLAGSRGKTVYRISKVVEKYANYDGDFILEVDYDDHGNPLTYDLYNATNEDVRVTAQIEYDSSGRLRNVSRYLTELGEKEELYTITWKDYDELGRPGTGKGRAYIGGETSITLKYDYYAHDNEHDLEIAFGNDFFIREELAHFDADGRITEETFSGRGDFPDWRLRYTYGERGELLEIEFFEGEDTGDLVFAYTYDKNGNIATEKCYRCEDYADEDVKELVYEREYVYEKILLPKGEWPDYYEKIKGRMFSFVVDFIRLVLNSYSFMAE